MDILQSFELFHKDKNVYCSSKTCEYYRNMLHVFWIFLSSSGVYHTDNINAAVLKDFVIYLRQKKVKNTSIHTYFRAVKNYCSWGIINAIIPPFDYHIKLPRQDPEQILPLSKTEVDNILKYIKKDCQADKLLLFRLMIDCGLRSSEALSLRSSDIDIDNNIIKIKYSKFDKSRMIPLPDRIKDIIPDKSGKLFDMDISGKNSFFARLKVGSGVQRVHAHLLRHTFATSYMVKIGNLENLRMYLGHSNYDITKTYIDSSYQCKLLHYDIYEIDDAFF